MICTGDIQDLLNIRDLTLTINKKQYKFNSYTLKAFSNIFKTDITQTEFNIKTTPEAINLVTDFLSFKEVDFKEHAMECLVIAATFDIPVLCKHLFSFVEETTTKRNFMDRYRVLSNYPNYCLPLISFLIKNHDFFINFPEMPPFGFVKALLTPLKGKSPFESEDEKLSFILNLKPFDDSAYISLIKFVDFSKLSINSINDFFKHQNFEQFLEYIQPESLQNAVASKFKMFLEKYWVVSHILKSEREKFEIKLAEANSKVIEFEDLQIKIRVQEETLQKILNSLNDFKGEIIALNETVNESKNFTKKFSQFDENINNSISQLIDFQENGEPNTGRRVIVRTIRYVSKRINNYFVYETPAIKILKEIKESFHQLVNLYQSTIPNTDFNVLLEQIETIEKVIQTL